MHAGPTYVHGQAERCNAAKRRKGEPGAAQGSHSLLSAHTTTAVKLFDSQTQYVHSYSPTRLEKLLGRASTTCGCPTPVCPGSAVQHFATRQCYVYSRASLNTCHTTHSCFLANARLFKQARSRKSDAALGRYGSTCACKACHASPQRAHRVQGLSFLRVIMMVARHC